MGVPLLHVHVHVRFIHVAHVSVLILFRALVPYCGEVSQSSNCCCRPRQQAQRGRGSASRLSRGGSSSAHRGQHHQQGDRKRQFEGKGSDSGTTPQKRFKPRGRGGGRFSQQRRSSSGDHHQQQQQQQQSR